MTAPTTSDVPTTSDGSDGSEGADGPEVWSAPEAETGAPAEAEASGPGPMDDPLIGSVEHPCGLSEGSDELPDFSAEEEVPGAISELSTMFPSEVLAPDAVQHEEPAE